MGMGIWESVGGFTGTWLGMTIWAAGAVPVGISDGPLPIMDLAWMAANIRNTNSLRRRGMAIGKGIDEYLDEGPGPAVGESWGSTYVAPETSNKTFTPNFNELPGGLDMTFDLFPKFNLDFGKVNVNFALSIASQVKEVVEEIQGNAMGLKYTYRNSEWPAWQS